MTQPAKVQEPSMEEILASIRRIIADDQTRPPSADKAPVPTVVEPPRPAPAAAESPRPTPAAPAASPVAADNVAPWRAAPPRTIEVMAAPEPLSPKPIAPAPTAAKDRDFDALLANLDKATLLNKATSPSEMRAELEPVPEPVPATPVLAMPVPPAPPPASQPFLRTAEPLDDLEFSATTGPALPVNLPPVFEPSSFDTAQPPILSNSTMSAVESAFNALADTVLGNNASSLEGMVREMLRPMLKSWLDDNLPGLVERIVRVEIERVSRGR